nr:rhodanese-like domain-containing protein [Ramlibacter paludis]
MAALLRGAAPPLLLDVRRPQRFAESEWLLPGAVYCAPADVAAFARSRPPAEVVVYCVHGHEVSQEAARTLREAGWKARWLQGGIDGPEPGVDEAASVAAWQAAPPPRVRKAAQSGTAS